MSLLLAALLSLPASAQAAPASACATGWQDRYDSEWAFTREQWDAACEKGEPPAEALRAAQTKFMAACIQRFYAFEEEKKVPLGMTKVHCAQGKPGETQLEAMTGQTSQPKAEASQAAAEVRPPGAGSMGPVMRALQVARGKWQEDACFSGLSYGYAESDWIPAAEWERSRQNRGAMHVGRTYVEQYTYYFASAAAGKHDYRVTFGDMIDAAFCSDIERLKGPDSSGAIPVPAFASCLREVAIDLTQAVEIARGKGLNPGERLTAYLGNFPSGFFGSLDCRVDPGNSLCGDAGWDEGRLRRATGGPVWLLASNGRTAFVDARKGRFRYLARGEVVLPGAFRPALHGQPCSPVVKH